jgi:hypothetical protein
VTSHMIVPTAGGCKRAVAAKFAQGRTDANPFARQPENLRHGIVSGIIILPNFRQAPAALDCDKVILRWPGPFGPGFLSPQPPGVVGIGPVRS